MKSKLSGDFCAGNPYLYNMASAKRRRRQSELFGANSASQLAWRQHGGSNSSGGGSQLSMWRKAARRASPATKPKTAWQTSKRAAAAKASQTSEITASYGISGAWQRKQRRKRYARTVVSAGCLWLTDPATYGLAEKLMALHNMNMARRRSDMT